MGRLDVASARSVYGSRHDASVLQGVINAAHKRLEGVHIECLDWADFIRRYDRLSTLFYLDPPYFGREDDYGKGLFARAAAAPDNLLALGKDWDIGGGRTKARQAPAHASRPSWSVSTSPSTIETNNGLMDGFL